MPADFVPEPVCCFKYSRVVAADDTVRLGEHRRQLQPGRSRRSYAKARVEVHERLDGSLAVYHQSQEVATKPAPPEAPILRTRTLPRAGGASPRQISPRPQRQGGGAGGAPKSRKPAPDHPWGSLFKASARTKSLGP